MIMKIQLEPATVRRVISNYTLTSDLTGYFLFSLANFLQHFELLEEFRGCGRKLSVYLFSG